MLKLEAKIRKETGKKTKSLKESGKIPAVVYGPAVKNLNIFVDYSEFSKLFKEAGESSLIELRVEGDKQEKRAVLIHDIQIDPVSDKFMHVDFFQASLKDEVEVEVLLVFDGVSPAVKDFGANLVKNFSAIEVKALPQNLPHEIRVNLEKLKNIGDHILVKDLILPLNVKVLKKPDEIVASVSEVEDISAELETPIEEDVKKVEKIEKEKKEEEIIESTPEEPKK